MIEQCTGIRQAVLIKQPVFYFCKEKKQDYSDTSAELSVSAPVLLVSSAEASTEVSSAAELSVDSSSAADSSAETSSEDSSVDDSSVDDSSVEDSSAADETELSSVVVEEPVSSPQDAKLKTITEDRIKGKNFFL